MPSVWPDVGSEQNVSWRRCVSCTLVFEDPCVGLDAPVRAHELQEA